MSAYAYYQIGHGECFSYVDFKKRYSVLLFYIKKVN